SNALIDAVEIDETSVLQARENISISPWPDKVNVFNSSFQRFAMDCNGKYMKSKRFRSTNLSNYKNIKTG
ncbi:MAG: hypothetical protein Q8K02_14635, partial [Flavobacterium sp.]|nr:hypothetical protein [Flavobacterium sp.]